jgi:c-di-GMP-binding flagellar brake protein YcgR
MDLAAVQAFEGAVDDQREVVAAVTVGERTHFFGAKLLKRGEGHFSIETTAWPKAAPKSGPPRDLQLQIQFGTSGAVVQLRAHAQAIATSQNPGSMETIVVRCGKPSELALVQRRAHFRAPVPPGAPLELSVWKVPDHWVLRDKPKPSSQLRVELVDISPGGVCLKVLPHRVGPEAVAMGDRLRAELQFSQTSGVFDCRVVYRSNFAADGSIRVGISFRQLENTIEGRRGSALLDRVLGALQRLCIKETTAA